MPDKLARIDPFPPSPAGRKAATKEAVNLDAYAPSLGNFTTDRQCLPEFEPGEWDPKVIGAKGSYKPFAAAPQGPGGKKSTGRVSY